MKRLPWPSWFSVAAVVGLLTVLNLMWTPNEALELSATTYGEASSGFGALYQTLDELGVEPQRSRRHYSTVDHSRPLWLMDPPFRPRPPKEESDEESAEAQGDDEEASGGNEEAQAEPTDPLPQQKKLKKRRERPRDRLLGQLEEWVQSGGTAVVVFKGTLDPSWMQRLGLQSETREGETFTVQGPLARRKRTFTLDPERVGIDSVHTTEQGTLRVLPEEEPAEKDLPEPEGATHTASGERRGHPQAKPILWTGAGDERAIVAMEVSQGDGRWVLVAGGRYLDNAQLAVADNALLASDLIAAYGAPRFDERSHGLWPNSSIFEAMGVWSMLLYALGVVVLPVLWLWSKRATPARELPPPTELDASLGRFVDSLAVLYRKHAGRYAAEQYMAYRKTWEHRHGRAAVALPVPLPEGEGALLDAIRKLERAPEATRKTRAARAGGSVPRSGHG